MGELSARRRRRRRRRQLVLPGGYRPPDPHPAYPGQHQFWDPKYVNFEFCSEIPSSGPSHSIRLVK